ncbi:MAG: hypothetical protein KAS32_06260 [Candidatus Peribacteraceae bacterium]|nr:hypothetical protein [Candidatus Peribacteraceae bacterium]
MGKIKKRVKVCKGCRIGDIDTYTEDNFFAYYKGYTIQIDRETPYAFYIIVIHPDGGNLYDGWWNYEGIKERTMSDAIKEALIGSGIIEKADCE